MPTPIASAIALVPSSPPPAPAVPREGGSGMAVFVFQIVLMIAIFYFILIRPQSKQRKQHQEMLKRLGNGDKVVTNGGIVGEVVHATDDELTVKTAQTTRIVVDRGYIARKVEPPRLADRK